MNFTFSTLMIALLGLFLFGCVIGYLIELLFRRFVSAKKWVNPGFLFGPWLPLYGFGTVLMFGLCSLFASVLPSSWAIYNPFGNLYGRAASGASVADLLVIGCIWVSLVLLEFLAGVIFVKGFKVRLWDYSNMRGNVLGVICPVFNVIWLGIAVLYYYGLSPLVYELMIQGAEFMFGTSDGAKAAHFGTIFLLGLAYGLFVVDLVKSLGLFSKARKIVEEKGILTRYEELKLEASRRKAEAAAKLYEALPTGIKEEIEKGKKKMKEPSKFKMALRKIVLIDPSINSTEGNYDSSGRPTKEE